tara:strand:+ start:6180 stop:6359 length:180 start_codon:yes stop_codon:yes gene_type:complete
MPIKKTVQEVAEVAVVNSTTFALTYTNIEAGLKLLLLVISIIYTLDKWYAHRKRNQKSK